MSLGSLSNFFDTSNLDFSGDGGVTNNTGSYVDSPPDASGGNGSFLDALLPTLTNGLNAYANSQLLQAIGKNNSLYTVDATGSLVPKSAAGANNAAYRGLVSPVDYSKYYIVGGIALLAVVAIVLIAD